jgi:hypothetical protein
LINHSAGLSDASPAGDILSVSRSGNWLQFLTCGGQLDVAQARDQFPRDMTNHRMKMK